MRIVALSFPPHKKGDMGKGRIAAEAVKNKCDSQSEKKKKKDSLKTQNLRLLSDAMNERTAAANAPTYEPHKSQERQH